MSKKEIKCLVWDLDHTLWDGILSEGDQVALKNNIRDIIRKLDARGILMSIASKNNYQQVMAKLKEFEIDHYFLYPEISWNAKSSSLANIQKNLNIGFDTLAFIDDDAFEREEVRSAHPSVYLIDSLNYQDILNYDNFNPRFITEDSVKRRQMYLDDKDRNHMESSYVGPKEEFLQSLDMKFYIKAAKTEDLQRAEELTIRTNQLNATGKTYSYDELHNMINSNSHKLYICELVDKLGSYGKIGLALVEYTDTQAFLRLMLMSCRVVSRGVGTILLAYIMNSIKDKYSALYADFKKTGKNELMEITYRFANFQQVSKSNEDDILFMNDLSDIQPYPKFISVIEHQT